MHVASFARINMKQRHTWVRTRGPQVPAVPHIINYGAIFTRSPQPEHGVVVKLRSYHESWAPYRLDGSRIPSVSSRLERIGPQSSDHRRVQLAKRSRDMSDNAPHHAARLMDVHRTHATIRRKPRFAAYVELLGYSCTSLLMMQ